MSTVQPTDKTLVNRAGVDHSAPADMSTVQDTDLLLINRAGVDYKCTFKDWKDSQTKPPAIASVTLADSPEAGRFTSGTFRSTVVMTDEGIPASSKGIKAYVEGTLKQAAQTSAITAVGTDTVALPASSWRAVVGTLRNPSGAFNGKLSTVSAGGGDNATACSGGGAILEGDFAPPIAFSKSFTAVANAIGSSVTQDHLSDAVVITLEDGSIHNITASKASYPGAIVEFSGYSFSGAGAVSKIVIKGQPGFSCGLDALLVDGVMLKDGMTVTKLTLTDTTNLSSFAAGDAVTESGNGNNGVGAVHGVDATAKTITLSTQQPNWDVGSQVKGPLKTQMVTVTPNSDVITNVAGNVLTFATAKDLAKFAAGDAVHQDSGGPASGTVASVDTTAKTMTLATSSGTWGPANAGHYVIGPSKTGPAANVKLYCKLDAAGAVSDLQSADPGFTAWTPAGTGPYTGIVKFPATLPSGAAPDTDLPAGTTITVEVEASNTSGSDSAKSNTVVPV
jgi:hypothetical protein